MRLGFWPPVYGNWLMTADPHLSEASFGAIRAGVIEAERLGFDTLLLAEHFINPLGPDVDLVDGLTTAAALAAITQQIEIIAAVKPGLRASGVIAKMAANISQISDGRFAINVVSAWWPPEYISFGLDPLDHDARYARAGDLIAIVRGLLAGERFSYAGEHESAVDATIAPRPVKPVPIYMGGESDQGRELAAAQADIYLMNGRPLGEVAALIADMRERAARRGRSLRFGMAGFVMCRAKESEAWAEVERLAALKGPAVTGGDPTTAMHQRPQSARPSIGINGGTSSRLVGSPAQIAARMRAYEELGVETFLLQFHPTNSELSRFGEQVMPLLGRAPATTEEPA